MFRRHCDGKKFAVFAIFANICFEFGFLPTHSFWYPQQLLNIVRTSLNSPLMYKYLMYTILSTYFRPCFLPDSSNLLSFVPTFQSDSCDFIEKKTACQSIVIFDINRFRRFLVVIVTLCSVPLRPSGRLPLYLRTMYAASTPVLNTDVLINL